MPKGAAHHRHLGIFYRHGRFLEGPDGHIDIVIGPLGERHRNHHKVGADRKIGAMVADDQTDALFFGTFDGLMGHGQDIAADGVHLGVELETEDTVAQINDRTVGVLLDNLAGFFEDLQLDLPFFDRNREVFFLYEIISILSGHFR